MTGGNANLRNVAVIRPVMLRDILTGRLVPTVPVKRRIPHSQYYSRWQQGFSGSRRTDSTGARRLTSRKGEKQRLAKEGKEDDGSLGEGLAMAEEHANALYYGDNLEILRRYIKDESVDLIYLDPPFNSDQNYNVLFADKSGNKSHAQIKAFEDTWRWNLDAEAEYLNVVQAGGRVSHVMQAFRQFIGENDMLAYLTMMAPRLVELRRALKPTGSIYLHCDPTASHYLKVLMDAVFGPDQFRNEIVWRRTGAKSATRTFGRIHDNIFFYSKTDRYRFNVIRRPYMKGHVESRYQQDSQGRWLFTSGGNVLTGPGATGGDSGQPWRGFDPARKNRHWAVPTFYETVMPPEYAQLDPREKLEALYQVGYVTIEEGNAWPTMVRCLDERDGTPVQDIWAYQPYTDGTVHGTKEGIDKDVAWMGPTDPERLGYQTQKPEGLLGRIIESSSDKGDVVLDPFCGCGTAITVAQRLGRRWIGIDITYLSISLIRHRMDSAFGGKADYCVIGEPVTLDDAVTLAGQDPYQFQWWALGKVGARPEEKKKGADHGIDGRLYFHDGTIKGGIKQIILSVKAGHTTVSHLRDLRGVIDREGAAIGVLITLQGPTKPMQIEAASAGFYDSPWWNKRYPRLQVLTIEELLHGKGIDYPPARQVNATFKEAPKADTTPKQKQESLL